MPAIKPIHWNHLTLDVPVSWETIVKSPRHLIFENELSPVLEVRWQQAGKRTLRSPAEAIIKQFGSSPPTGTLENPQEFTDAVADRFELTILQTNPGSVPSMLLICRKCGTPILIGLHRNSIEWLIRNTPMLASLQCCHGEEKHEYWQIQDFFFTIPGEFKLDSCTFQFGVSDLLFKNKQAHLRICRLAPASQYLQHSSLAELFASFCSAPRESVQVVDRRTLRYHSSPAIVKRLWLRLRRKRSFRQASFNYFADSDRILGYMLAANQSQDPDAGTRLENGYGIIQGKGSENDTDA